MEYLIIDSFIFFFDNRTTLAIIKQELNMERKKKCPIVK